MNNPDGVRRRLVFSEVTNPIPHLTSASFPRQRVRDREGRLLESEA
jgi:hypothetical protein